MAKITIIISIIKTLVTLYERKAFSNAINLCNLDTVLNICNLYNLYNRYKRSQTPIKEYYSNY